MRDPLLCLHTREVLGPQFHNQFSPAVSAKETFSSSPILNHLSHPSPTLPASCGHKCLCGHTLNPAGQLGQDKITLFLSLSLLVPLPSVRGEQNWLLWWQHQLIASMESWFLTAWYGQTRENALLLKAPGQTTVSRYRATK